MGNVFVDSIKANREINSNNNIFGKYLLEGGLYSKFDITEDNIDDLIDLVGGHVKLDIYCPKCKAKRVFVCEPIYKYLLPGQSRREFSIEDELILYQDAISEPKPRFADSPKEPWSWYNEDFYDHIRIMTFKFHCTMDYSHTVDYVVVIDQNTMMKIGQYPSVASLTYPELKNYRKVMPSEEDEKELKRARGLYSSGIGVGAFVYLRRIYERIINSAGQRAIKENRINEEQFKKAKEDERIRLVADYIPKAIIDDSVFYKIISKGIHELSEEECKDYFPALEAFIMLTLKQWEDIRREQEEEKKIHSALNDISSKMKKA